MTISFLNNPAPSSVFKPISVMLSVMLFFNMLSACFILSLHIYCLSDCLRLSYCLFVLSFCRRILKRASYIVELTDKEENMSDGRGVDCEKGACGKVEGEEKVQLHTRACCESKTQNINLLSVSQSMRDRATSTESLTCTIDLGMESDEEVPHCGN